MAKTASAPFESSEVGGAFLLAGIVQLGFFALLVWAGASSAKVPKAAEPRPEAVPIAVQPVLDDLPLLKLGSNQKLKPKLPDMWKKQAPVPVRRLEERSAPSEDADPDELDELPESPLADDKHPAPSPSDELTKEAIPDLQEAPPVDAPAMDTEGSPDGSKDGTETDPLKARALDQYKVKIATWFNARFRPPTEGIPCDELKRLNARVTVRVGGDRSIVGFTITAPSGNGVFDAKVQSTLTALVGQELPPPPPLYPDILGSSVFPILSGSGANCATAPAPRETAPAPENEDP